MVQKRYVGTLLGVLLYSYRLDPVVVYHRSLDIKHELSDNMLPCVHFKDSIHSIYCLHAVTWLIIQMPPHTIKKNWRMVPAKSLHRPISSYSWKYIVFLCFNSDNTCLVMLVFGLHVFHAYIGQNNIECEIIKINRLKSVQVSIYFVS